MRLTTRQSGIISYAGLDKDGLWAAAKRALAQAEEEVPERFATFLPLFPVELVQNMSYVGSRVDNNTPVSPQGFSIDPAEYHQKLCEEMPELYQGDNRRRNFNFEGKLVGRGAMTVDEAWATRFPQYQPFLGERLHVYMIGGGHQAVVVPESVYPRGGRMLRNMELEMRVSERCEHFVNYIKRRMGVGEKYDPAVFETDYLRVNDLLPVVIRQSELGHVMQDLCILRDLKGERPASRLFTENAKRAEGIAQYAPYRCACDSFTEEPVTRATARLLQLYYEDDGFISDLWLPYQDASEYIDKRRMTLDVGALCRGFQLAPEYDPAEGCGRYPDRVRVVIVRDREVRPMVASTINNPAYGSGTNPLGMLNRLVCLRDSQELLRQNRLAQEGASITCENTLTTFAQYRAMVVGATAQELKGRLIDAMYRRESALSQMQVDSRPYLRARELLDAKVEALTRDVERLGIELGRGQLSGYDADIDYLRRMAQAREGLPEEADGAEPMPFVSDTLREMCIESGYAMRNRVKHAGLGALERSAPSAGDEAQAAPEDDDQNGNAASRKGEGTPDDGLDDAEEATEKAPDKAPEVSGGVQNGASDEVEGEMADEVSDKTSDKAPDEAPEASGGVKDEVPDEVAGEAPSKASDEAPEVPDGAQNNVPNDKANDIAGEAPSKTPNKAPDKAPAFPAHPAAKPPRTPVQFEQLRMFGAEGHASAAPSRATMAGMPAARTAAAPAPSANPSGSMARIIKQKKKKKK